MVTSQKIRKSLIERAGGKYTFLDPDFVLEDQVAFIEDLITVRHPDALILQPVQEEGMATSAKACIEAGIPVFNWDLVVPVDEISTCVWHDFDTPGIGSEVVGDYFVRKAEEMGEPMYLYECWCVRSMQTSWDRHNGFRMAIDKCPLITVIESGDTMASDEITAEFVMDAFTVHPELNALYHQCGGSTGAVEGLRAIGRLVPPGEPGHVWVCTNDTDIAVVEAMDEGCLDAMGTHQPWDLVDTVVKLLITEVVLGQPVPRWVVIPMTLLTPDNADTLQVLGGPACYPHMPIGDWDLWPVLDAWNNPVLDLEGKEITFKTPTKAMRMELLGY